MRKRAPELEAVRQTWDQLAATDPLWAICSQPDKKGNRWTLGEFMETGVDEVEQLMRELDELGLTPGRGHALDFGCGVGRLTQALGGHFAKVTGIDISSVMLDIARAQNRPGIECRYVLNDGDDLSLLADGEFDLIYSNVTLQHMPPRFALNYIQEFIRLLAAGGVLVFQLPSHAVGVRGTLRDTLRTAVPVPVLALYRRLSQGSEPGMLMRSVRRERLTAFIEDAAGHVVAVKPDVSAGPRWASFRYFVIRQEPASSPPGGS